MMNRVGRWMMLVALVLALVRPVGAAATIEVDGTDCTLINAITAANTDTETNGCSAGSGADTLNLSYDVTLTAVDNTTYGGTGLPVVTSDITIMGNGHTISRQSEARFRILAVSGSGARLTLDNVTVSGGATEINGIGYIRYGGGVLVHGSAVMTATHSTIRHNSAGVGGGIAAAEATVYVLGNSVIHSNTTEVGSGGGIWAGGIANVTVIDSTIRDNHAASAGGGISVQYGSTTLTLTNSTLNHNTSVGSGGGIDIVSIQQATVTDSTVDGKRRAAAAVASM